ncbi:MAG TPA: aminotransferase class IV [Polyangiaceae bacterium]
MASVALYALHAADLVPLRVPAGATDVHALLGDAPVGVYSALRSYPGRRFLRLGAHLERCRLSLERAGWGTKFDLHTLVRSIDRAAQAYVGAEFRVRLDLLEHPTQRGGVVTEALLALAPHSPVPSEIMSQGARLALAPAGLYRPEPLIKYTDWVRARSVCDSLGVDAYEYLLLDEEQRILEATSANFYLVRQGAIVTAESGILEGITRQIVLELARQSGLDVDLRRPTLDDLARADEAFISSSTREIVPVTAVAATRIGSGMPGPIFERLRARYQAYAAAYAAPAGALC